MYARLHIKQVLADLTAGLTVETTPAGHKAGLIVGEHSTRLRQASWLNLVIDDSTFGQLKQGNVIPA